MKQEKSRSGRRAWVVLAAIILFELWIVYAIPTGRFDSFLPDSERIAVVINRFASVVTNFDGVTSNPAHLHLYFSLTILLIIPKAIAIAIWFHSDVHGIYRQHVVSPLTATSPRGVTEFIVEPVRALDPKRQLLPSNPRSMVSRIFWSILIVFVALLLEWAFVNIGWEVNIGKKESLAESALVIEGGWKLWGMWSVAYLTFVSILVAIQFCILRDYVVFFYSLFGKSGERS